MDRRQTRAILVSSSFPSQNGQKSFLSSTSLTKESNDQRGAPGKKSSGQGYPMTSPTPFELLFHVRKHCPVSNANHSPTIRLFEDVSVDIFSFAGNHYFTDADRLSRWPTVHAVFNRDYRTKDGTQILTRNFVDLGGPVRMRSYGGPQFDSA